MQNDKKKEAVLDRVRIKLNLIPPERKKEIAKSVRLKLAVRIEVAFTLVIIIFFAVLLSLQYILGLNLASQEIVKVQGEKASQSEKILQYDKQFEEINAQISKIMTIRRDQLYWSEIFFKLNELVFSGITVTSLHTSDYSIVISGDSDTRDDLILFKEKLEKEDCFSNVNLPLSNLVDKNNIKFQIDFNIDKNCLKKK
jgi:Tfp pilus assembly protein PilN